MVGVRKEQTANHLVLTSRLRCREQNGELGTRFVRGPWDTLPLPWHMPLLTGVSDPADPVQPTTTPLVLNAQV